MQKKEGGRRKKGVKLFFPSMKGGKTFSSFHASPPSRPTPSNKCDLRSGGKSFFSRSVFLKENFDFSDSPTGDFPFSLFRRPA